MTNTKKGAKVHTNIRMPVGLFSAIKRQQELERRRSQTETITCLLEDGLERRGIFHFNRACTLMGITSQREAFSQWRHKNDVPAYATMPEWLNYAEAFETAGDDADLRDTQARRGRCRNER